MFTKKIQSGKKALSNETLRSNSIKNNGLTVLYECWYQTWTEGNGAFGITNTQCSFSIIITGGIIYNLIGDVQVPQPDESSGGPISEEIACLTEQINNFSSEAGGATIAANDISQSSIDIDQFTKAKSLSWTCLNGFGGWSLLSNEDAIIKLINVQENKWAWVSLSHNSITMQGSPLPGTSISHSNGTGTPSFTPQTAQNFDVFYAGIELKYSVTYTFICNCAGITTAIITPKTYNYTSNKIWHAQP